ncbi:hypothetical protein ACFL1B_04090 [Nanoarchaeota archaeon]
MRKGQGSASGAAILVVVIALMIILYILFLPPEERLELLGEGEPGPYIGPDGGPAGMRNVLLTQSVGRIFPPSPNEVDHTMPSFTIFTSTNARELARKSSMSVRAGLFGKSAEVMSFSYDPSTTTSVMLSFNAKKTSGRLVVILNEELIFDSELHSGSPPPITLPKTLLRATNELKFSAPSPGLAFWSANKHDLTNVIVSGEVTDKTGATADQHFSLPEFEYQALDFAELRFLPNCETTSTGRLRINVNNQEVFSGYTDCGVPNKLEVAKEILKEGDNTVRFVSEEGQYLVDMVKVTSRISGQDIPLFYFNVPGVLYDRLFYMDSLLFISIRFADARSMKTGVINLNGFETSFRTQDIVYMTQVDTDFLLPGPNSLMIMPQGQPMDVVELRVEAS